MEEKYERKSALEIGRVIAYSPQMAIAESMANRGNNLVRRIVFEEIDKLKISFRRDIDPVRFFGGHFQEQIGTVSCLLDDKMTSGDRKGEAVRR